MRKPNLGLASVDNALRLLLRLAERDRVRLSDIAAELDIAPSTAHRLLNTLRQQGFVEQDPDRSYVKGPAYRRMVGQPLPVRPPEDVLRPFLETLRDQVNETSNLAVLDGTQMRFVAIAESGRVLRVGARIGGRIPAHRTSGGKAILAALPPEELKRRFPPDGLESLVLPEDDVDELRADLEAIRRRGYGLNLGESEHGVAAVGVSLLGPVGAPLTALSISLPSVRFSPVELPNMVTALMGTKDAIEAERVA